MFRNVLVAIDGSAHAERALAEAVDLVVSNGGSLTLVAVAPGLSPWMLSPGGMAPPENLAALQQQIAEEYQGLLDTAAASVPGEVPTETVLLEGPPAAAIVSQVREGGYDLVAMGSRGRGEVTSLVLGSTSHAVLRESAVPVLVIHLPEDKS
jgi:nucleotide-binding universal stress UspA family protein